MFENSTDRLSAMSAMAAMSAKRLALLCIAGAALPIGAQQSTPKPADPLSPAASVPAVTYQSPFADYRPMVDQKIGNWKDANDNVNRVGGWRTYLKEAQEPDAPLQKQTPQSSVPAAQRVVPPGPSDQRQQQEHQPGHSGHTAK